MLGVWAPALSQENTDDIEVILAHRLVNTAQLWPIMGSTAMAAASLVPTDNPVWPTVVAVSEYKNDGMGWKRDHMEDLLGHFGGCKPTGQILVFFVRPGVSYNKW